MTRTGLVALTLLVSTGCAAAEASRVPSASPASSETPVEATERPLPSPTPVVANPSSSSRPLTVEVDTFPVTPGSHPHDVAPAADGGIWYTGQGNGTLGWLDPDSGDVRDIPLGAGSMPHGVITGPDDAAWVTDGGLNAIVRVDGETDAVTVYPIAGAKLNLNTAAFDADDILWFTGQNGAYGSLDPESGELTVHAAPPGPYGIAATAEGDVYFSSLAGSYLGAIDRATGEATAIPTPTPGGGARRVWADSTGRLWVTQWFAGSIAVYDPADESWNEWPLPAAGAMPYAVYVDERDAVWVTDFGSNALLRLDPATETWLTFPHDSQPANVRQLLGRPGEVWGAESAADQLIVARTEG
jgi:virginiamycin B lyase